MNLTEITRAVRKLRVSGMAATLETRIVQAQGDHWPPLDVVSALVQDELQRRQDRLLERRVKQAGFRDVGKAVVAEAYLLGVSTSLGTIRDLLAHENRAPRGRRAMRTQRRLGRRSRYVKPDDASCTTLTDVAGSRSPPRETPSE